MKRRRMSKAELVDRLPPGLRPKLRRDQLRDLAMCHPQNLDAVATGEAQPALLWDYVESTLLWLRVAQLVQAGVAEMEQQCTLVQRLIERWKATGRVLFTGPDLQLARDGVVVMDQLAALADRRQAVDAALWSEMVVAQMQAQAASGALEDQQQQQREAA